MSVTLHRMIMHKIDKTQHRANATPTYKDEPFSNNETLNNFTNSLSETYNKKTSKEYANFRSGENIPVFQSNLNTYLEDSNDNSFNVFSRQATELLADNMNNKPASTGGFIIIADYTASYRFILIALVNKKEGYTENNLDIVEIEQLNIDQLGMAGFVNVDNYQNTNSNFRPLSFMRGTKEVSDYFATFLGAASNIETSSHMTGVFINALKDYYTDKEYDLDRIEQLNQNIYSFCSDKIENKEPMNIASISSILDPDNPSEFFEFTQDPEKNYNLNTIIEAVNRQQLNKLKSFSYKGNGLKLSFDKALYNHSINLDRNNNLVISDLSEELLAKLQQEF